jgi:hypothetical protein
VDVDTLLAAVEAVTGGRASTASTVIADPRAHPSARRTNPPPAHD